MDDLLIFLTSAEKQEIKKKLLGACIQKHKAMVMDLRRRVHELIVKEHTENARETVVYLSPSDQESKMEITSLRESTHIASQELENMLSIQSYSDEIHHRIKFGSVVETDKEVFFISVETDRMYVDGVSFMGVSIKSKMYQAMRGRLVGELFFLDDTSYLITDIF